MVRVEGTTLDQPLTDAEVVARLRAGEDGRGGPAFRCLYERHAGEVLRFLARVLGGGAGADDALQEIFVRLHRALPERFDPSRPLRPYLLRIARNVAIEALRRRAKRDVVGALPDDLPDEAAREGVAAAQAREREALVAEALGALAPEHRAAVVLRHTHGLKVQEVADALGCSERTARNRLRTAAVLLERELRRRGVTPDRAEEAR